MPTAEAFLQPMLQKFIPDRVTSCLREIASSRQDVTVRRGWECGEETGDDLTYLLRTNVPLALVLDNPPVILGDRACFVGCWFAILLFITD
jgi:hypothetical protein